MEKARVEARARGRTSHPSMTSNGQDRVEMKTVSFSPHRSWCRIRALAGVRARLRDKHGGPVPTRNRETRIPVRPPSTRWLIRMPRQTTWGGNACPDWRFL